MRNVNPRRVLVVVALLVFPAQSQQTNQAQIEQWMRDLDSVVDRAQSMQITGWDVGLTALRICQLNNLTRDCATILKPIYDEFPDLRKAKISERFQEAK